MPPEVLFRCRRYEPDDKQNHSPKVVFFFCAMLTRIWLYRPVFRALNRAGFTVYAYDVQERKIFTTYSAANFIDFVEALKDDVQAHIDDEKPAGARSFAAFGVSMGTIYALYCAKYMSDIDKAVINLTYGSIAHNVWTYRFHRPTKARFVQAGVTDEDTLRKQLGRVETADNAKALRPKAILLYSSKTDQVLADTMQFKAALRKAGVKAESYDSIFGHYLAGTLNLLRKKRWLDFLSRE